MVRDTGSHASGATKKPHVQDSGHKQSAVAEGYNILTLDELRPYMAQIERRFLDLAGVQFDAKAKPGKLRVVAV